MALSCFAPSYGYPSLVLDPNDLPALTCLSQSTFFPFTWQKRKDFFVRAKLSFFRLLFLVFPPG